METKPLTKEEVLAQVIALINADNRPPGSVTALEVWELESAQGNDDSVEKVRSRLDTLAENGVMVKSKVGGRAYYSIAK